MKKSKYLFIILTSLLFGCFDNIITFEKENSISKFGQPQKIEYFKHKEVQAFSHDSIPSFSILSKTEIDEVLQEIKSANSPEPWKGAGWDRIVLTFNDTIIRINTNKQKIGLSASGSFYDLNKDNFITKRLKEK
jgi:DNA-directed RNA polymerase subunit H (RpoH/RPB5)